MHGILAVDKPRGWTSHDVVARVRSLTGQRRAGHAGTLDPMATGVLLVCLGEATRVSEQLMDGVKWYLARVSFGERTDTDDSDGQVVETASPAFGQRDLEASLTRQVGSLQQIPPAYAAIKQGGVPAYRRARRGDTPELAPRPVTIHSLALLASRNFVDTTAATQVRADLLICCSKGTYIRSIARDLGTDLGCGAHLAGLRRLASGPFTTRECLELRLLQPDEAKGSIATALLPVDAALTRASACLLGPAAAARISHGLSFAAHTRSEAPLRVYDQTGRLLALAKAAKTGSDHWHPYRVFAGGR